MKKPHSCSLCTFSRLTSLMTLGLKGRLKSEKASNMQSSNFFSATSLMTLGLRGRLKAETGYSKTGDSVDTLSEN